MNAPRPGKARKTPFLLLSALALVVLVACAVAWVMGMDDRGRASHKTGQNHGADSSPGSPGPGENLAASEADGALPDSDFTPDLEEETPQDRNQLPVHPDEYQALPLPDPTEHPSTESEDDPATVDSHVIGDNPSS